MGPPKKRRPQPGGNGCGPLENIALGSNDGSEDRTYLDVAQLLPRPVRPDEVPELRAIYWRQARAGFRLPAEAGVILIEGGRS